MILLLTIWNSFYLCICFKIDRELGLRQFKINRNFPKVTETNPVFLNLKLDISRANLKLKDSSELACLLIKTSCTPTFKENCNFLFRKCNIMIFELHLILLPFVVGRMKRKYEGGGGGGILFSDHFG